MKFIEDPKEAHSIDHGVKNKWSSKWLCEEDSAGRKFSLWLKKTDTPGEAWCLLCSKSIAYGSNGKRRIESHALEHRHVERLNAQNHTTALPTAEPVIARPPKTDELTDLKIRTVAFLAEHCLPFSLAPALIDFTKTLAKSHKILDSLSLSRTAATYTLTHGVSRGLKKELLATLNKTFFSLTIDEATNNAGNKVVNGLVRYFNEEKGEVETYFLGTFSENRASAQNIFDGLESMLRLHLDSDAEVPWRNCVSCLMDNCNVMRGTRGGVETLARRKNPQLLDVHGDTVHIVSTIAKEFCRPFESYLEDLSNDLFYNFKLSPKAKGEFFFSLFFSPFFFFKPSTVPPSFEFFFH